MDTCSAMHRQWSDVRADNLRGRQMTTSDIMHGFLCDMLLFPFASLIWYVIHFILYNLHNQALTVMTHSLRIKTCLCTIRNYFMQIILNLGFIWYGPDSLLAFTNITSIHFSRITSDLCWSKGDQTQVPNYIYGCLCMHIYAKFFLPLKSHMD